ncbi:MAG: 2Fe-2S iron-sulfur cluster binding domain-containing protein [Bdellovibrionaceae bacterium]|nr:2Fe-2S iron-sulfur cluster binding domain-containing protein [Pseudobdellovibrionaceae bacterium]
MKIKFMPQNIEVDANPNKSLLQIATENNIEIKSICKGVPSCAECRVNLSEGENNVIPPNKTELNLIGTNWHIDGRRLSCQVRCFGDVTVDMTEQLERQANQTKKVRGFRSQKTQQESQAVQDTMILSATPEQLAASEGPAPSSAREPREPREPRQRNQNQPRGEQQPQQARKEGGGRNKGGGRNQRNNNNNNKPNPPGAGNQPRKDRNDQRGPRNEPNKEKPKV